MEIYILRHGKAQDRRSGITSDAGRRLTESGRAEMRDIASGIASLGIVPDVIISSPLVRAKETAGLVLPACQAAGGRGTSKDGSSHKPDAGPIIWQELMPEADIRDTHRRLVRMSTDSAVMLVGHEPHLSSLASSMILDAAQTGRDAYAMMSLKKGGLVIIRGHARGQRVHGFLRSLMTPKQLKLCGRQR